MASLNSVTSWDYECDVLICGYGCALEPVSLPSEAA